MSFNVFYTQGRLGGDPDFRMSKTTKEEYCIFQVAYQYRRNTKPHWLPCNATGKTCEIIKELGIKKGDLVTIRGSIYQYGKDDDRKSDCPRQHLYCQVYQLWILAAARTTESKHFKDVEQPRVGGEEAPPFA